MTCFIATLKVKPGQQSAFERLQTELSVLTHQKEPDTFVYDVLRSPTNPTTYVVYGRFKDEAAFQHHQKTPFHERLVPAILETLGAEMDLQFYEWVA